MRPATTCLRLVLAFTLASIGCGDSPTSTTTTTTTVPPTTTSTAPVTTTSTVPPTTTGTIAVQNPPCIAPATGAVSCTFVGTGSGGQAPYTYSWLFTGPLSSVTATGAQVSPVLGCGLSAGTATFNLSVALTITPATGPPVTITGTQLINRATGSCGA
jgi:hypothetical protein